MRVPKPERMPVLLNGFDRAQPTDQTHLTEIPWFSKLRTR